MHPCAVTTHQAAVLGDLAIAVLQKRSPQTAALVCILSGKIDQLEPEDFRWAMTALIKSASGKSLDVIGKICGLDRGTTVYANGECSEIDTSFSVRLLQKFDGPKPPKDTDRLLGISLRTVLHFHPQATFREQEAAIEKAVKGARNEIIKTESRPGVSDQSAVDFIALCLPGHRHRCRGTEPAVRGDSAVAPRKAGTAGRELHCETR